VPQTGQIAHRNGHDRGFIGFMNAYLLTGDDKYLAAWRKQIDLINSKARADKEQRLYPHMYGDQGWYDYKPQKYTHAAPEIYYLSMQPADRTRVPANGWFSYLEGKNPGYAEAALRGDLERMRQRVAAVRKDTTTPDTRLADDPLNPCSVESMIELAMGGLPPKNRGRLLFARLRYFDPVQRRAGLPPDVAALIDKMNADEVTVTLVNTNPLTARRVIMQGGAYGEHRIVEAALDGRSVPVNGALVDVRLAPGAGGRLTLKMQRYVNPPTLRTPFE